ncbi:MAG TPA: 50S ribosomal protein L4 [Candidatus Saccharimonadia bacterium]|jgi:large subunit ribosomal protein L4
MANAVSYSKTGAKREADVKLDQQIFGLEANHGLVGQAYRTYLANGRLSSAKTLKRGEVRGGGKKPWRQKGTGRARVGSIRVPQWKGGGVVFGPTGSENHTLTLPMRMKRLAIRHALSLQAATGHIAIIEAFASTDGKVKPTLELLGKMRLEGNVMLVVTEKSDLLERATRNVESLELVSAKYLNVYTVMNADHIIFTADALEQVKSWLGEK